MPVLQMLSRSISLGEYARQVAPTDRLGADDLKPTLLGLYGEVGSLMATAKKLHREGSAFLGYRNDTIEEFGDVLWYFTALCRRLKADVDIIFSKVISAGGYETTLLVGDTPEWVLTVANRTLMLPQLDVALLKLGQSTAALLPVYADSTGAEPLLTAFGDSYLEALQAAKVPFGEVVEFNIHKTRGRFVPADINSLPKFDDKFEEEERIPSRFAIETIQRKSGKTYLRWNGVFIGDPLTDNILDPDGYRFHDVFHFAHAAVLHWSPTFRALIKHKRKSDPAVDEAQDGGRAIVVEEGLTAWIFSRAKDLGFFENSRHISFDMLKTIQQFTAGYEVQKCPLSLWEDAILQGYSVFRDLRAAGGGIIVCDRDARKVTFTPRESA